MTSSKTQVDHQQTLATDRCAAMHVLHVPEDLRQLSNCRDDEAAAMASAIEVALVLFDLTPASQPRQYWKMPELSEFTYRLSSQTRNIWGELAAQPSVGQEVFGDSEDRCAVWNRGDDRVCLAPAVRWAELTGRA